MATPKPTPRKRGRAGQRDRERRRKLYPLCQPCLRQGRTTATEEIDHIVPLHQGGPDTDGNCRGVCIACHKRITAEQRRAHHKAKTAKQRRVAARVRGRALERPDGWVP